MRSPPSGRCSSAPPGTRAASTQLKRTQQREKLFPPILVPPPEAVNPKYCTKANPEDLKCKAFRKLMAKNAFPFTTLGCQEAVTSLCGGANATKACIETGYALCDALALGL